MADVFVSYSRADRESVATLAHALERRGWSVWWDPQILPGAQFDRVIETEIAQASCVLVIWSRSSVDSDWVRAEASTGLARGCLVSASLESAVVLPLRFTNVHTESLEGWSGNPDAAAFQRLCGAIEASLTAKLRDHSVAEPQRKHSRSEASTPSLKPNPARHARWPAPAATVVLGALLAAVSVNVSDRVLHTPDSLVYGAAFVAWLCGMSIIIWFLRRWY